MFLQFSIIGYLAFRVLVVVIKEHLFLLCRNGVDVRGYFALSFLDNFEWGLGYRFRYRINFVILEMGQKDIPRELRFGSRVFYQVESIWSDAQFSALLSTSECYKLIFYLSLTSCTRIQYATFLSIDIKMNL